MREERERERERSEHHALLMNVRRTVHLLLMDGAALMDARVREREREERGCSTTADR
jgi:hypothetical protein